MKIFSSNCLYFALIQIMLKKKTQDILNKNLKVTEDLKFKYL